MQVLLIMLSKVPWKPSCFEYEIEHHGIGVVVGHFPSIVDEDILCTGWQWWLQGSSHTPIFDCCNIFLENSEIIHKLFGVSSMLGISCVGCFQINREEFVDLCNTISLILKGQTRWVAFMSAFWWRPSYFFMYVSWDEFLVSSNVQNVCPS